MKFYLAQWKYFAQKIRHFIISLSEQKDCRNVHNNHNVPIKIQLMESMKMK